MKRIAPLCLLVLLLCVVAAATDYCSFTSNHVLCNNIDASNIDEDECGTVVYRGVTNSDIRTILKEHNDLRSSVAQGNEGQPSATNMLEMEWDPELALIAQAWADTCIYGISCTDCRRVDRFYVGQNVYASYSSKGDYVTMWDAAVAKWKEGISKFDTSNVASYTFNSDSASYTQLVWGSTSKIGCGLMVTDDGSWNKGTYVCMYGPGGNVQGAEVYGEGESCSACPSNLPCSTTYTGICKSSTPSGEATTESSAAETTPEPPSGGESQCSSDYCSITSEHTLCKYEEGTVNAANCVAPVKRKVSRAQRETILDEHNSWRSRVAEGDETNQPSASNMRQMEWDEELEAVAQTLADQCEFKHDCNDCRRVKRFAVGQNIYTSGTSGPVYKSDWPAAIKSWYDEVLEFNTSYLNPYVFDYDTAHYTQVVWANTWKIGCGFISYTSASFKKGIYVCNYGPAGNYKGQAMYLEGDSCTACPDDTECSDEYDGLCESTLPDECAAMNTTTESSTEASTSISSNTATSTGLTSPGASSTTPGTTATETGYTSTESAATATSSILASTSTEATSTYPEGSSSAPGSTATGTSYTSSEAAAATTSSEYPWFSSTETVTYSLPTASSAKTTTLTTNGNQNRCKAMLIIGPRQVLSPVV